MKKLLLILLIFSHLKIFSQGIVQVTSLAKDETRTTSIQTKQLENNEYNVELFPGEKYDGCLYYYSNSYPVAKNGFLYELPSTDWLNISPNRFVSAGCDSGNIIYIKFAFTAPNDTGLYKTVIKDEYNFYPDITVVLHVTAKPKSKEINIALSSCKTSSQNDTIVFFPAPHGCVEKFYPANNGDISLSTYPKNSFMAFEKAEFNMSYYQNCEYTRLFSTVNFGKRDTIYEITYMEWVSYPLYKKIICETKPDENLILSFNNICSMSFPVIDCYVTVSDSCGSIVKDTSNLKFELNENGKKENIEIINKDKHKSDLSITFIIDRSGSMEGEPLLSAKTAAKTFIDRLGDRDIASLFSFSSSFSLDQEYTNDKSKTKQSIDRLNSDGMTAVYDALYAAAEYSQKGSCRNIIILLTDGGDNSSHHTPSETINRCITLGFPVYTIGLGNSYDTQLQKLADNTGGSFAHADNSSELNSIYEKIFEQIESQFLIRYTTSNPINDGSLREIKIKVSNGKSMDEKSKNYYAPKKKTNSSPSAVVLLNPENNKLIQLSYPSFPTGFKWNRSSDLDSNDTLKYILVIESNHGKNIYNCKQDTMQNLDLTKIFRAGEKFNWYVLVSDGLDTISSNKFAAKISDGISGVIKSDIPQAYSLNQNYPNPFNPATNICYNIPKEEFVTLTLYDINGREVEILVNKMQNAGSYRIEFNASKINSGVYYYKIRAGNYSEVKKMLLIK